MALRNGQARPAACRAGRLHLELWRQCYRRVGGDNRRSESVMSDSAQHGRSSVGDDDNIAKPPFDDTPASNVSVSAAYAWRTCVMSAEEVWREMSLSTFCVVVGLAAVDVGQERDDIPWGRAIGQLDPIWQAWCRERGTAPFLHALSMLERRELIYRDDNTGTADAWHHSSSRHAARQSSSAARTSSFHAFSLTPLSALRLRLAPIGYRLIAPGDDMAVRSNDTTTCVAADAAAAAAAPLSAASYAKTRCGFVFWQSPSTQPGSTAYAVMRYWRPDWCRSESTTGRWDVVREGARARRVAAVCAVDLPLTFPRLLALSRVLRCDVCELAVRVYQCGGQPWRVSDETSRVSRSAERRRRREASPSSRTHTDTQRRRHALRAHTRSASVRRRRSHTRGRTRRDDVTAAAIAEALERGCASGEEALTRRVSTVLQLLERTRRAHRALRMSGLLSSHTWRALTAAHAFVRSAASSASSALALTAGLARRGGAGKGMRGAAEATGGGWTR